MAIAETTERLEARITPDQKDLFKRAASLRGVTLTDFVVSSVHEAAVRTLEAMHVIEFGRRDPTGLRQRLTQSRAAERETNKSR